MGSFGSGELKKTMKKPNYSVLKTQHRKLNTNQHEPP